MRKRVRTCSSLMKIFLSDRINEEIESRDGNRMVKARGTGPHNLDFRSRFSITKSWYSNIGRLCLIMLILGHVQASAEESRPTASPSHSPTFAISSRKCPTGERFEYKLAPPVPGRETKVYVITCVAQKTATSTETPTRTPIK